MKRLIIAQIKIELDSEKSDYAAANITETKWSDIIADYLVSTRYKVESHCSIQIDETKDN